jgi:hypothetical protein
MMAPVKEVRVEGLKFQKVSIGRTVCNVVLCTIIVTCEV